MKAASITRDEWLAALGEADRVYDDRAETLAEIAFGCKIPRRTASERLAVLLRSGGATKVFKRVNGRAVPAYLLKAKT